MGLAGGLAIGTIDAWSAGIAAWVRADPAPYARLWTVLGALGVATTLPLVGAGAYLWSAAGAAERSGRFPPPGFRLLAAGTPLSERSTAAGIRVLRVFAAAALTVGLGMPVLLWRLGRVMQAGLR